ncbi:TetR/AcrR family transcriptional regulator [Saccharopolyspora hirsuta]|uniref:TetR/AcrR family transcriptional regulator n=1 Tax=Saccharopolyspora hirsuta TaxID=1837 RepID=A0A5M7BJA3_SACHI|nr:TetR/AcrR family transcriptional regulator [Saccharopolyspora hirsuta]KAA5830046.1 TetR/AcrR family transcriptional regulator [Saccharopolyspora hirsuta]MBF6507513.1 TetR/AcrR family transcriptional regulator [Nocardia farcinica]
MAEVAELLEKLTPAGRRVLDVAAELFYGQGIHAVGVEAIAAGAGVTKKTLYACFGSKDQLVTAYLVERDQRWREWLSSWVAEHASGPREELLAVFDALGAWMDRADFRGCGFVNALAETPDPDHPARAVIVEQKRWMREYFEKLAAAAGVAEPGEFADSALLLFEGATVVASADIPGAVQHARRTAEVLLGG